MSKPFGPWLFSETESFLRSVTRGDRDSINDRFNLNAAADELAYVQFNEAEMWLTLETYRKPKWR